MSKFFGSRSGKDPAEKIGKGIVIASGAAVTYFVIYPVVSAVVGIATGIATIGLGVGAAAYGYRWMTKRYRSENRGTSLRRYRD
ncbi:MAG: hypothetical protein Q7R73_03315 [bacterium]|nr:hypothetical protein [bacterium]